MQSISNYFLVILIVSFGGQARAVLEITISPEWQDVDIQKIPMTVNVLSDEDLSAQGTARSFDIQHQVTGFDFKSNTALGQPYLRGVGTDVISSGSDTSVATFVDGIYMTRPLNSSQNFFDVKRVEVLKGPQAVTLPRPRRSLC
ncbi:MAG: Plug domain-containing protein [Candidatus Thiodiazotropha endolucinida]